MQLAPRALLLGLGLIGGSIGIALRRAGWRVVYFDPRVRLHEARAAEAADRRGEIGDDEYDVTVLATPLDAAIEVLPKLRGVVTSVCSMMQPLRKAPHTSQFIAGHPLAGSAERGITAARGDLFQGKRWFVDRENDVVTRLIRDCGATHMVVDAAEHDAAMALTSHMPQILSTALAAYLGERDLGKYAGSGLATFLRLAASDASIWAPTLKANRAAIAPHVAPLMRIVEQIVNGDDSAFEQAQSFIKRIADSG